MKKLPIYLIESKTRQNLAETFMRFQEYYESPVFKGRFFSVQEFATWYISQHGKFSYHHDWSGFNIPSTVLEPFKNGSFGPLSDKESNFVNFFKGLKDNFYVIGITREDPEWLDTLRHELTHGLYFVEEKYRSDVLTCISQFKPGPVKTALSKMGYEKNVLDDEVNAYLMTEPQTLEKNINISDGKKIQKELDFVFQKHFGYSIIDANVPLLLSGVNSIAI